MTVFTAFPKRVFSHVLKIIKRISPNRHLFQMPSRPLLKKPNLDGNALTNNRQTSSRPFISQMPEEAVYFLAAPNDAAAIDSISLLAINNCMSNTFWTKVKYN